MDIRGLDTSLPLRQSEPVKPRVIKGGTEFPALKPEALTPAPAKASPATTEEVMTSEEKQYFAALFPESSPEIANHVTYSPRGVNGPVQTGRMIDRKG